MGKRVIKTVDSAGNERDLEILSAKNLPPEKGVAIVGGHPSKGVKIMDKHPKKES